MKMHDTALQGVVNDLVKEKEDGWKCRTLQDSYMTKLKCLELMEYLLHKMPYTRGSRHASHLVSMKGEKFESNRADWMKLSNIKQMYEYIYEEMFDAHIASPREKPVYKDHEGYEVEESERFGLVQEINIDHPDYILFEDESGCQTNQKQDGNVGNRKYIVKCNTTPQVICNTADQRFTILPFTSGSIEAVCCVLIFQHKEEEVPMTWKTGIDITLTNPVCNDKGEIDFELNLGESKYYPEGPKCMYRGKEVDCLNFASEVVGSLVLF
jgi:hypothetical protein